MTDSFEKTPVKPGQNEVKVRPMLNESPHFLYCNVAIMGTNAIGIPYDHTYFCAKENLFHAKKIFVNFKVKCYKNFIVKIS